MILQIICDCHVTLIPGELFLYLWLHSEFGITGSEERRW
jgi:hypothetical protein